jgi:hypothetical protein
LTTRLGLPNIQAMRYIVIGGDAFDVLHREASAGSA